MLLSRSSCSPLRGVGSIFSMALTLGIPPLLSSQGCYCGCCDGLSSGIKTYLQIMDTCKGEADSSGELSSTHLIYLLVLEGWNTLSVSSGLCLQFDPANEMSRRGWVDFCPCSGHHESICQCREIMSLLGYLFGFQHLSF